MNLILLVLLCGSPQYISIQTGDQIIDGSPAAVKQALGSHVFVRTLISKAYKHKVIKLEEINKGFNCA